MPPYIQPTTLLDLSFAAVKLALLDLCHQLHENKMAPTRQLRELWQQLLPTGLRQQLLLRTVDDVRDGPGPLGYYLVGLLLGPDIGQLRLELCCYYGCSHQASLLKLLASAQGKSLTRLQLSRSALLRLDQCLLQSVLLNAEGLQQLTMRNIATDATLSAIGSSCKNLVQLDVSNSRQISDQGIKQLFLQIELRNKTDRTDRNNYAVSITTTRRSNFVDKTARRLHQTFALCLGSNASTSDSCRDFLLECFERQTALCDKLQVLNLTNTGVTSIGILIALENCANLQSVGDYAHIHQALELLEMRAKRCTPLQLVSARNTLTNHKALQLIYRMCPRLQQLSVMDTRFTPSHCQPLATPAGLTSLTLLMVPATAVWITHFCAYLATSTPTLNLTQLTLVFSALVNLELANLMQACTSLQVLIIDGANITYNPQTPSTPCHNLQKVQLGQNICSTVPTALLAHCPRLTIAHFYNCHDLRQLTTVASQTLQCFYIYQAKLADIGQAIVTVLANCPQLEHLGNLANWTGGSLLRHRTTATNVINHISATNYRLQFEPGAHWYHSKCIKNYE